MAQQIMYWHRYPEVAASSHLGLYKQYLNQSVRLCCIGMRKHIAVTSLFRLDPGDRSVLVDPFEQ